MLEYLSTLVVGLIGGIAVGIQSPLAGAMSQRVGGAASSLVIHVSGALFSLVYLALRGGENIGQWRSIPWYMFGSGLLGLILYITVSRTIPQLGATLALVLIIVGQLITGIIVDHLGLFGLTPRSLDGTRVLAVALLLAGAYLASR